MVGGWSMQVAVADALGRRRGEAHRHRDVERVAVLGVAERWCRWPTVPVGLADEGPAPASHPVAASCEVTAGSQ